MMLFVYGTLRRGANNHAWMNGARFAGYARTAACYELVDLGSFPAVVEGGSTSIEGELWEVNDTHVAQLDRFEDVPSLYERKLVRMALASPQPVEAYVMRRERAHSAPRIPNGDWHARSRQRQI